MLAFLAVMANAADLEGNPTDRDWIVGLGVRGGLRYERSGWALGASFGGFSSASASGAVGSGVYAPFPRPPPRELTVSGPSLSLNPLLWIGWRPSRNHLLRE